MAALTEAPLSPLPGNDAVDLVEQVNGLSNGHINGDVLEKANEQLNGHIDRHTDGGVNGELDGEINGYAKGEVDGVLNARFNGRFTGYVKGRINGHVKGHVDGDLNGQPEVAVVNISSASKSISAWETLSKLEPSRGPDHEHWWKRTAPQLALLLEEAGYPIEKQFETLLFYYHWIVPYMGPKPQPDGSFRWRSLVSSDGTPLEYSWKWDTPTKGPDVRLTIEAINATSGTVFDPLNQAPSMELLHHLQGILPTLNQTWTSHFLSTFYDHDKVKYVKESESESGMPLRSTMLVCFEFGRKTTSTKTYMSPRRLGQQGFAPTSEYMSAIRGLGPSRALDALTDFLESSPEGKHLNPFMLAVDNVDPASSRLKFYFASLKTSYASIREILTLGGRISGPSLEKKLRTLHELVKVIMPMPADLPDDADIPGPGPSDSKTDAKAKAEGGEEGEVESGGADMANERPAFVAGYQYYFDIAPGAELPDIKFYVPIRKDAMDDLTVAKGLTGWMESQGRGAFCESYIRSLEGLAGGKDLAECHGIQTHICCMINQKGEFDVTSYLAPGVPS